MLRRIPFEKVENFRDVGGYYATYGETGFGIVYRSGSLSDATENDIRELADLKIRTIMIPIKRKDRIRLSEIKDSSMFPYLSMAMAEYLKTVGI